MIPCLKKHAVDYLSKSNHDKLELSTENRLFNNVLCNQKVLFWSFLTFLQSENIKFQSFDNRIVRQKADCFLQK